MQKIFFDVKKRVEKEIKEGKREKVFYKTLTRTWEPDEFVAVAERYGLLPADLEKEVEKLRAIASQYSEHKDLLMSLKTIRPFAELEVKLAEEDDEEEDKEEEEKEEKNEEIVSNKAEPDDFEDLGMEELERAIGRAALDAIRGKH